MTETMDVLNTLNNEHKDAVQKSRFDLGSTQISLLDHIQPQIVRLNESKHTNEVSDDGPKTPPYAPNA